MSTEELYTFFTSDGGEALGARHCEEGLPGIPRNMKDFLMRDVYKGAVNF